MKIYISLDMEGVNGAVFHSQVASGSRAYEKFCKQQQKELKAVIEALLKTGVSHITVNDAHNSMDNITIDDISPDVELISGKPKPVSMMHGLDEIYDAVFFLDYHSMAGNPDGVLAHTFSTIFNKVLLNGKPIGEIELNAIAAGKKNIPVAFLSGDNQACEEIEKLLGKSAVSVITKQSISLSSAKNRINKELFKDLKEKTLLALKNKTNWKVYNVKAPFKLELDFVKQEHADIASFLPCVKKENATTVSFISDEFEEIYKILQFFSASFK